MLECWFVREKPGGGGFSVGMSQEKSALYIRTNPNSEQIEQNLPSDISPSRVYYVSGQYDVYFDVKININPVTVCYFRPYERFAFNSPDPASTFCSAALHPPEGTVNKPQCEINPFTPQASTVKWATSLTTSAQSPIYLSADWFSVAAQGLNGELTLANVMRAPSGSKEPSGTENL